MTARAAALLAYAVALLGAAALGGLVLWLGQGHAPPGPTSPFPWLVDAAALLLFAIQHSGMARARFKSLCLRLVPRRLERSLYAGLSGLLCLGLALAWQPLPGPPLWQGPAWLVLVALAGAAGLAAVNAATDHLGLFGVRQAWGDDRRERLLVRGPYRWARHPLMACLLVFLWAQPTMPPALLLLAGGLTLYILLGTALEERDLLRRFGPAYAAYRRRVPALVPWRGPAPPADHPSLPDPAGPRCASTSTPSSSTPPAR